jgi:hypothetical protein
VLINLCILVEKERERRGDVCCVGLEGERGVKREQDKEVSRKARQRIQEKARQRDSDN